MPLTLEERTAGDVTVVNVTGDVTLSSGGDVQLKNKVQSLLLQGRKKILLDLANVAYVDSGGLGQMVQCHLTAQHHGASVRLLRITKRLKELLVVTRLATTLASYDDEDTALTSF